jgi:hypothetical protein
MDGDFYLGYAMTAGDQAEAQQIPQFAVRVREP